MTAFARRFVFAFSIMLVAGAPNLAQADREVPFLSRGGGQTLFLMGDEPLAPLVLRVEVDRLEWTPVVDATGYDVVLGDLGTLRATRGDFTAATQECLADDYAPTELPFTADPERGQAFWLLGRWVLPTQAGSFDSGGQGQVGPRDAEIDASPLACLPERRPHAPIVIDGDSGFTEANGVIRGTGTAGDPYLIASWDIPGPPGGAGILIGITNAHFVIRNVGVHGGQYGILLNFVHNGRIDGSTATGNTHGIRVFSGGDIEIEGNVSSSNTQGSGIDVLGAANVLVRGNTLARNMVGINLDGAAGVQVDHNNILNNVLQAIDQRGGPNAWDDGYPDGGNYWTNYQGIDQCSGEAQDQCDAPDGLGDTPYAIGPDDNSDRYPLMILPGSGSDTALPTVAFTSPPNGAVVTTANIVVQGVAADAGSGVRRVEVRVNDGAWVIAAAISPWSLSVNLIPGSNLIEARSFDHAGNISAVRSISVLFQSPLQTSIVTNKTTYLPGETVAITLRLTNGGASPEALQFRSSCEAFFSVQNMAGAVVYDRRFHVFCLDVIVDRTIQPGETVTYNFNWTQVDDSGAPVPFPADYRIRGFLDSFEPVPDAFTTISIAPPDTDPPTVGITSPASGAVFTFEPITVVGVAADTGSGLARVEVRVNGGPWLLASGTSPWNQPVGLSPGDNLIEARSWDRAGNTSTVASISVAYQTLALETVILTDKATYAPGELVSIALRLTNREAGPVTLHFSSGCEAFFTVANDTGTLVYDFRQHVGCPAVITERTIQPNETVTYPFSWNQVDDSGAPVPVPANYRIRGFFASQEPVPDAFAIIAVGQADTIPPTVGITSPSSGAVYTLEPIDVQGVAADTGSGLDRVEVRNNGGPWLVASGTSSWSLSIGLSSGTNLVEARSFDLAGNASAVASISVTYQAFPLGTVVQTNKSSYAPGERVLITLRLTNHGTSPVTLNFSSSCEAFFMVVNATDSIVYDDRQHAICLFVFTQRTVQPGQTVTYDFEWDQITDSGQQVPFGSYRILGFLDSAEFVPETLTTIAVGP